MTNTLHIAFKPDAFDIAFLLVWTILMLIAYHNPIISGLQKLFDRFYGGGYSDGGVVEKKVAGFILVDDPKRGGRHMDVDLGFMSQPFSARDKEFRDRVPWN